MPDSEILKMLKIDLQIAAEAYDEFLSNVIDDAKAQLMQKGIILEATVADGMLVEQYAAWLYRSRRDAAAMPLSLRCAMHDRLISQKGRQ